MIDVGSAVGYLTLDTSGFSSGLRSARSGLRTFEDESATAMDKFSAVGSSLTSVGTSLTKFVTVPLVGLGATVATVTANFESSMSKVAAISGLDTTGKEFDQLSEKAKQMGATTKFSASQAADAFTYMAMAGWKTEAMLDGIDGIMNLAAASGEDLALTSDIVTDALTGFGLTAKDSSHFADVLAAASNNANTNVAMLGESFKYVAPVAGALGFSAEDTSIALGLMANSGIKASQAGTALRASITNMVKPTDKMVDVMKKYGITITDSEGNMKSLMQIMVDLRGKFGGLSEAEQANAAATLFGKEAMSGMLAIINASDEDFDKLTKSIYSADGTAKEMADTMQNNLTGQITILKSALEGLAISFGEIIIPYLTRFVQWLTQIIDKFNALDEGTQRVIVIIATIAAALGPVLAILGKLISVISSVVTIVGGAGGLGATLAALSGPIGIVIAAVAALVAAWVTNFGNIREYTSEIFESIKTIISTILDAIKNLWDNNFMNIQQITSTIWESIKLIFETTLQTISNIFKVFAALLQGDWKTAWELVKQIGSTIWEAIKELFMNFLNLIVDTLIKVGVRLLEAAKGAFGEIRKGFKEVWENIREWFSNAINDPVGTILDIGEAMYEAGSSIFSSLWEGMKSIWDGVVSWVTDAVEWVKEKVRFWRSESSKVGRGRNSEGSYASGLDYVPRDMIVKVHRGERIVTAEDNKDDLNKPRKPNSGGDTFNFYSPKPITEVTAARQMKKAKQQLAAGMV